MVTRGPTFIELALKKAGIDMSHLVPKTWFPSNLSLNVVGNGHIASGRSVVLSGDHKSYIFNCGEGFQRSHFMSR